MNKLQKEIILELVAAQASSDGGKDIYKELWETTGFIDDFEYGYPAKDYHIQRAITLIRKNKSNNVKFYYNVKFDKTYCSFYNSENTYLYIVYFNIQIEGKRYQISFHTLHRINDVMNDFEIKSKSCSTRWNKKVNSRDTALELLHLLSE